MVLLIDNYDSFVYNLARYVEELGVRARVVRNDALTAEEVERLAPQAIILSPGPCDPPRAGISMEVVRRLGGRVPILGVCLGHQAIASAFGGGIRRTAPVHGRTSAIHHDGAGIFRGLPSPFLAARYHSLLVERETLPELFEVSAWTEDGLVMGIRSRRGCIEGIQFHPESVLTEHGHTLLANFLEAAGIQVRRTLSESA